MIMVEMTLAFLQSWPLTRLRRGSGRFDEDSVGPRDRKLPGCWKSVEQATYTIIVKHEEEPFPNLFCLTHVSRNT